MEENQNPQRDVVTELETFLWYFILVCLVIGFIRLLCKPFRGAGWRGWLLGILVIPMLCIALIFEATSFALAKHVDEVNTATVVVDNANIRAGPSIDSRIIGRAQKGLFFDKAWFSLESPNWILIRMPGRSYFMHRSTLKLTYKTITYRAEIADYFLGVMVFFYCLGAYACIRHRKRNLSIVQIHCIGIYP